VGTIALHRWLQDVRRLHVRARASLQPEVVHDLRVAIRRCRSVAQGLKEIDDVVGRPLWRALNEAGRPLFQGLGALRDAQVMRDHAGTLLAEDPALPRVLMQLERVVRRERLNARAAVLGFDAAAFAAVVKPLPKRAGALVRDEPLLMHLALRRYEEGRLLHAEAMRTKGSASLHELRIRVKRLRYTVESFLPIAHEAVGRQLKKAQDALGELHDFDVLLAWINSEQCVLHSDDRSRVCGPLRAEREARLRAYHELATGPESLWVLVRSTLADGRALVDAHRSFLHQHTGSAERALHIAHAADALFHTVLPRVRALHDVRARTFLSWACALVGEGGRASKKNALSLPDMVGLGRKERALLALIARSADGRLPRPNELAALLPRDGALVGALSALLHVASQLPARALVRERGDVTVIFLPEGPADSLELSSRRAVLERLIQRPLWVEVGGADGARLTA
jgi:CHAD domain-containing protein